MAIRRINLSDLAFGEPLRWDVFGPAKAAAPLLQKGEVIDAPSAQLEKLLAEGLYAEAPPPASILQCLNQLNRRLERTLMDLRTQTSADTELRQIARELIAAVACAPDVALACIFLNQIAGLYAVRHCVEAAIVVALIGRAMDKGQDELLTVTAAALTMNVGMVRQTEIFQDKDCALSSEERAMVRRHPAESADLLRYVGVDDQEWIDYVLLHHENEDGSGYPEGRQGPEIPQNAKLIALADRYCAFVSARNYRRSLLPHVALDKLCAGGEVPVDAAITGLFVKLIGAYPPGSLVRLRSGEVAVVARRADDSGRPALYALRGANGKAIAPPEPCDNASADCAIEEALHEDQAGVRFSMKAIWGELASL
ncbi:MAG: HD domain-containing phosphohydrolase [Pseudomonadota bacterium]